MQQPKGRRVDISVICPVLNADPATLRLAIASVLAQDAAGRIEIILVDDGSQQATALTCLALQADRVRVVRRPRTGGPASARNSGIAAAQGSWIGFLDADDLWRAGRITAARALMAQPDIAWIAGRHSLLLPQGAQPAPWVMDQPDAATQGGLTRLLLGNFWLHLGTMLVRRELVQRLGGFAEGLRYYEDWLFAARLSTQARLHPLAHETYTWRRAGGGLTASPARLLPASLAMFDIAARDPLLRDFRREIRWARYAALKGLALNNLLAGRRGTALALALRAWRTDPRELGDLLAFLRLSRATPAQARHQGRRYSQAEIFVTGDA